MGQIRITSRDGITVTNGMGRTLGGWRWNGSSLRHPGGAVLTPTPQMAARLEAAIAAVVPPRAERKGGLELSRLPEAEREGFEWDGEMDGNGVYQRTVPGTYPPPLSYAPSDFGQ